ncbi:hypothetical protein D3C85_846050 [compost metagenome]
MMRTPWWVAALASPLPRPGSGKRKWFMPPMPRWLSNRQTARQLPSTVTSTWSSEVT